MTPEDTTNFFKQIALWQAVVAGLIVAVVVALFGLLIKRKRQSPTSPPGPTIATGPKSTSQVAIGNKTTQDLKIDKSRHETKGISITVEPGATANINIFDYQDGVIQTQIPQVKNLYEKARAHLLKNEFGEAIAQFTSCLELEKDTEKQGALNTQIGNCYYELCSYLKAAEFYAAGLREARKANDAEGQASNLANIGNTYLLRPAGSGRTRGANVRKAVENYIKALEFFLKDEYPVQYAMTQNNLGNAYTDLPSETPQQRAENVRKAIQCYQAALQIYKKDEYPQDYCFTAANMGMILAPIDNKKSCYWLKKAYALRQFLPDQGKRIEDIMNEVCE